MKLQHKIFSASTVLILGISTLLIATPASAATTPSSITVSACNASAPGAIISAATVSWSSASDTLLVVNNCNTGTGGQSMAIQVYVSQGGTTRYVGFVLNGGTASTSALGSDVSNIRIFQFDTVNNVLGALLATVSASSPSTGGGGSSSAPTAAPQTFELSLAPADGTTCTNSSESGTGGTWVTLPGANDCTPPATKSSAKLLG